MAHNRPEHRYTVELYQRESAECLGAVPVTPDFEPALEWGNFWAVRHDPARPLVLDGQDNWIEPCWDAQRGEPYLSGLRAMVASGAGPAMPVDIPLWCFGELARAASAAFVAEGKLTKGEVFEYRVCAYPATRRDCEERPADEMFSIRSEPQEIPLDACDMDDFLADLQACGLTGGDEMPVFIPRELLDEVAGLMEQAGAVEIGGILLGHLHRDRRGEVFLEITAQVPAEHAQHELTRLTFSPDSWAAVDAALALRGRGELYGGWWHTHPAGHWCEQCPPETQAACRAAGKTPGEFFSLHDAALHRAVFPRAYSVALVLSDGCRPGAGPVSKLYGWQYGTVQARGYHVLGGT